ncbi:immunity 26/phosphotriesterase HocA family protein [Paenibacillus sp. FSL W7-1287]|uniref:immunity 26/phosphotriesterase HocA family protein n=1 Tax=Paenibacillus sp. FSL W7-1287 TaxID=2954538 RepID=UPI0030F8644A
MSKSRKRPVVGDVFVVQPFEGSYYFCKVIKTKLQTKNENHKNMNLIYIYNYESKNKEVPDDLDRYSFLLPPTVVNNQGWLKGYYETVQNLNVSDLEENTEFGFFDNYENRNTFYDINGEKIDYKPKYSSFYWLASYGAIGRGIHRVLKGE